MFYSNVGRLIFTYENKKYFNDNTLLTDVGHGFHRL